MKVVLAANGGNIALNDHNGIVNSSHSLINNFKVNLNGRKVYDLNDANHCVNIKNLLEYSPIYIETTGTNEFFYLDTTRHAEEREFTVSGTNQLAKRRTEFNKGFAVRKALLGTSATLSTEIPLNRYSFFRSLRDQLLPNTRLEINLELESDANLIWQAGADCRVIVTKMQLYVPRITFNSEGQSLYASKFITNKKMDISERRNHEIKFFNTKIRTFQYYKWNKQNQDIYLFSSSMMLILILRQLIHFCTTLFQSVLIPIP